MAHLAFSITNIDLRLQKETFSWSFVEIGGIFLRYGEEITVQFIDRWLNVSEYLVGFPTSLTRSADIYFE